MSFDNGTESAESTESQVDSEAPAAVEPQQTETPQEAAPKEQETPFHEHPRFKELVEQKNNYAAEAKQLKDAYFQLQNKISSLETQYKQVQTQPKPSYDPLFKELEGIRPEFANLLKETYQKAQSIEAYEQRLSQQEQFIKSYEQQQALTQFDRLCEENKVDSRFKDFYREAVANAANASGAKLSALPDIFKDVHGRLGKSLSEFERSITEKYVTQKTQDVKKPATQTGGIASPPKAPPGPISKDDIKKQLAAAIRARTTPQ